MKCKVFLDIQSFDWVINYRLTIYNSQPTFSDFTRWENEQIYEPKVFYDHDSIVMFYESHVKLTIKTKWKFHEN